MATTAQARGRPAKDIPVPLHYSQANRSPDWPLWKMAIEAALAQLRNLSRFYPSAWSATTF